MLFYIIPYLFILFFITKYKRAGYDFTLSKIWIFSMLIPALLLVVLRGNIGTDTYTYLSFFEHLEPFDTYNDYEPGFEFFASILVSLGFSARLCVAIIGVITTFFLVLSFSKTKESILLFFLLLFPLFFYDMTMNGLRYGLAFSIVSYGLLKLHEQKYIISISFLFVGFLFQYTAIFIILPFVMSYIQNRKYLILISILMFLLLLNPTLFDLVLSHAIDKQDAYAYMYAPSKTTGLFPLTLSIILYLSYITLFKGLRYSKIIHVVFILEVFSYFITKFSYAGVRFQTLFLYAIILYLNFNFNSRNSEIDSNVWTARLSSYINIVYMMGIIAFLFTLKNISSTIWTDEVLSPFLPYRFFWQELEFN